MDKWIGLKPESIKTFNSYFSFIPINSKKLLDKLL